MKYVIGVDIGTQGTKAHLYDETGRRLASAFVESKLHRPSPGIVEEDPETQIQSVRQTIRTCATDSSVSRENIVAVAIAGQMAGIIGIDPAGKHITPYDSWLDTRCTPQIHKMEKKAGDEILDKSGCAPGFNHGPKILWWKETRPAIFKKIAAFVQPGAYAAMRLCRLSSGSAFIDNTYLHFCGFADNQSQTWNANLCEKFAISPRKLPRITQPAEIIGEITGEEARACGLAPGTLVAAGCGDTAASFLACGATRPGIAVDVAGTASVFAATTQKFAADKKFRVLGCGRSAVPGLWHPYAYIGGGGMNLEWFRAEIAESSDFTELNRRAAEIKPDEDIPFFLPHLGGRACPSQPAMRGAFTNLQWNHTRAHLYRAVLESVALEYAIYQKIVLQLFGAGAIKEFRITGGGEKSDLWNQIKANVLQRPVRRLTGSAGAPMGAAVIAGAAAGLWRNIATQANRWIQRGPIVKPIRSLAKNSAQRIERYESLLEKLQ